MLVAETHGHRIHEVLNSEDYLTSAVFGHLRYLSPKIFWLHLFRQALAMPGTLCPTLADDLTNRGIRFDDYDSLEARFWATHPEYGCPDLILVFSGSKRQPFVLLIEAKLWSDKSGTGEFDQIARYLRLLENPARVAPPLPETYSSSLVYLTAHDALAELEESVTAYGDSGAARQRIFRLQWQDIVVAAQRCSRELLGIERLILQDVAAFLRRRNLEYFRGFERLELPYIQVQKLPVLTEQLFTRLPVPSSLEPRALIGQQRTVFTQVVLPAELKVQRGLWV